MEIFFQGHFVPLTAFLKMASDIPSISEWLQGRNVFITGGSGFMGKVLIYKLLVSCDHLENIFVLIRKKKDVDPQSRLQYMIKVRDILRYIKIKLKNYYNS